MGDNTAGSPQDGTRWTNLRPAEITELILKEGFKVSKSLVKKLLKAHGYVRRSALKNKTFKSHPDRPEQFDNINVLKDRFLKLGLPVISIDTKKKELLGTFYRNGKLYTQAPLLVNDHDFPSYSTGKVVPHGIYDIGANAAHVNIGKSSDTAEFACDSIVLWWNNYGSINYPDAEEILFLFDGGGSNASNSHLFKIELQRFSDETGLKVTIAHYPPYCSKYNPIEHRVFPHITRSCQGVVFENVEVVADLIAKTSTKTGLKVTVDVIDKVYETGRKVTDQAIAAVNIVRSKLFPKWNYTIKPTGMN